MKTYEQAVAFATAAIIKNGDSSSTIKWVSYLLLSDIYGKTQQQVYEDIEVGISIYHATVREERRMCAQQDHELRRQANLDALKHSKESLSADK